MRHVILNLHGLGQPNHTLPEGEAAYWISPDLLKSAITLASSLTDRVKTRFTFDDGNLSDLEIGAPLLKEAGFEATFFVLSSRIGQENYLSGDDLRRLMEMEHKIGHHGADHVDWTALDASGFAHELQEARTRIEAETKTSVQETAIPFGRYNAKVLRHLKAAGFQAAYSSDGGDARPGHWPVPRTSLTTDMTEQQIEDILLGREPLKRSLRRALSMAVKKRV